MPLHLHLHLHLQSLLCLLQLYTTLALDTLMSKANVLEYSTDYCCACKRLAVCCVILAYCLDVEVHGLDELATIFD